jgi:hypothetical protein
MASAPFVTRLVRWTGPAPAHATAEPSIANQKLGRKWMKLVKTSAIAIAMSAILAGPVLAQGAASDTQIRGGAQGRTNMQGGASGSSDEDLNAQAPPGAKAGVNAKAGTKGTVGAATGAVKGNAGAAGDPAAGGKRY